MLYNLDGDVRSYVQREEEFGAEIADLRSRTEEYHEIIDAINEYIDGKDWFISSFIPGSHWEGSAYEAIRRACNGNQERSGKLFGIIVWRVVVEREDEWYFKPPDQDFDDVLGMTYFRRDRQQHS